MLAILIIHLFHLFPLFYIYYLLLKIIKGPTSDHMRLSRQFSIFINLFLISPSFFQNIGVIGVRKLVGKTLNKVNKS